MASKIALLVVSCEKYRDLWAPFFHCLRKYWPTCPYSVTLGTDGDDVSFGDVAMVRARPGRSYSASLREMLSQIGEEWVLTWGEDLLLCRSVSGDMAMKVIHGCVEDGCGFARLLCTHPLAIDAPKHREYGPLPRGIRYRVSMMVSLWRKDMLVSLLRDDESAWEFEKRGSRRSDEYREPFMGMSAELAQRPPIQVVNTVVKGCWTREGARLLRREGFSSRLTGRPMESIWSLLYRRAYLARLKSLTILGRYW